MNQAISETRYFRCDCGWPAHALAIGYCNEGINDYAAEVEVYIVNHRRDLSLWERIKSAWDVLRGNDHRLSEIILHQDDVGAFVDFVAEIGRLRAMSNVSSTTTTSAIEGAGGQSFWIDAAGLNKEATDG